MKQDYYFFIDESGDHGLSKIDPDFPIFVLCGVIMRESDYKFGINASFNQIKDKIWGNKEVIFHSSDIRKWKKEFSLFINPEIRQDFFQALNNCISQCNYSIIASAIQKEAYTRRYGTLNDVYSISLSFILERVIFFLDGKDDVQKVNIFIEKRGKKEDAQLLRYFNMILDRGTSYVSANRFKATIGRFEFMDKKENENGMQLADLVAYPIATSIMRPERANPAFDILKGKFYARRNGNYVGYGLKIFS
jgi:hypothetical protein